MSPKFISKVKLTRQGQLTLPIEARNDLGVGENSEMYWYEHKGYLILTKILVSVEDLSKILNKKKKG